MQDDAIVKLEPISSACQRDAASGASTPPERTQDDVAGATYTVALASEPVEGSVTVTPVPDAGTDVLVSPATLTFTADDWETARLIGTRAVSRNPTAIQGKAKMNNNDLDAHVLHNSNTLFYRIFFSPCSNSVSVLAAIVLQLQAPIWTTSAPPCRIHPKPVTLPNTGSPILRDRTASSHRSRHVHRHPSRGACQLALSP